MADKNKKLIERFGHITLYRGVFLACLMLQPFILVQLMPLAEYARYAFFVSLIAIAADLAQLGLEEGFIRFALRHKTRGRSGLIPTLARATLNLRVGAWIIVGAVYGAIYLVCPQLFDGSLTLFWWIMAAVLGATLHNWLVAFYYGCEEYRSWSENFALFGIIRLAMIPGAYILFGFKGLIPAIALAYWATALVLFLRKRPRVVLSAISPSKDKMSAERYFEEPDARKIWKGKLRGRLLRFSIPWFGAETLRHNAHPIGVIVCGLILGKSAAAVGYFNLAAMALSICVMFSRNILDAIYPEVVRAHDTYQRDLRDRWLLAEVRWLAILAVMVILFVTSLGETLIDVLLPERWSGLYPWLVAVVSVMVLRALQLPLIHLLRALHATTLYFRLMLGFFITYMIFYSAALWLFGDFGLAWGFIAAEALLAIMLFTIMRKLVPWIRCLFELAGIYALGAILGISMCELEVRYVLGIWGMIAIIAGIVLLKSGIFRGIMTTSHDEMDIID